MSEQGIVYHTPEIQKSLLLKGEGKKVKVWVYSLESSRNLSPDFTIITVIITTLSLLMITPPILSFHSPLPTEMDV